MNFGPRGSRGAKILKGVKIFCNSSLIYCLAKHDEIWHNEGHWHVGVYFQQRTSCTISVGARQKLAGLGV